MSMLGDLLVRHDVPVPGYDRTRFGPAWADTDRNGCDARNDILRRDLTEVTVRAGTCVVRSGVLRDPYTGITQRYALARAQDVQVDHVVSMFDAWRSGAHNWPRARLAAFANDPLDLLAVSGTTNDSKGDSNAAGWLPPLLEARCSFAARQVGVKARYGLSVTAAEKHALQRTLEDCLGEPAVHGVLPTLAP